MKKSHKQPLKNLDTFSPLCPCLAECREDLDRSTDLSISNRGVSITSWLTAVNPICRPIISTASVVRLISSALNADTADVSPDPNTAKRGVTTTAPPSALRFGDGRSESAHYPGLDVGFRDETSLARKIGFARPFLPGYDHDRDIRPPFSDKHGKG